MEIQIKTFEGKDAKNVEWKVNHWIQVNSHLEILNTTTGIIDNKIAAVLTYSYRYLRGE